MEEGGEHWKGSGLFPQYPSLPQAPDTRIQSQWHNMLRWKRLNFPYILSICVNQLQQQQCKGEQKERLYKGPISSIFMY